MKVLLVTNDFPPKPGGIQQYFAGLIGVLDAEVRVLAPADSAATPQEGVFRGHRRFMWPTRRTRRWVSGHIGTFQPDIVLFGAPHPLARMGERLRSEYGVPFAVMCHGAEVTVPAAFPILKTLVARPLRAADGLMAVSEYTARKVRRLGRQEVTVVGAGVDDSFHPSDARVPSLVVGCVSRFVPRKGQRRLIKALAALREGGSEATLLLVGKGRDEGRLRRLSDRLRVPTRFEVGVPFDRLPELYREMAVFAMPCRSRWLGLEVEGLGIVFLEAAASGLPVIAGDSGGAPETVAAGVTGFVVDRQATLIDALKLLLEDPELAQRMGDAGRQRVVATGSWRSVADRFETGLASAIERFSATERS